MKLASVYFSRTLLLSKCLIIHQIFDLLKATDELLCKT